VLKAVEHCAHALSHSELGVKTTTYLESPIPVCLFTMQLLWGYDNN